MRRPVLLSLPRLLLVALVAVIAGIVLPTSADPAPTTTGWTPGQVAVGTARVLSPQEPLQIELPDSVATRVVGDTAIFYFSPTCPHCQHAMPEINQLAGEDNGLLWLGVALGTPDPGEMKTFRDTYHPAFDIIGDGDHSFARAVGARATPSVYFVRPLPAGTPPAESVNAAAIEAGIAHRSVQLFDAYSPWVRGIAGLVRLRRHTDDPFRDFHGYQSDATCGACHVQEAESWLLSLHSVAYRTLYRQDRAQDLPCVGCHVTGMGQPDGFVVGDHSHPQADVTCEACHGPSGPHDGERTDARSACEGCHDAEHSVAFSVAKGLPHIDHFQVNAMTEDELRARVLSLTRGDAPRPLLAFPDGPTVGAAACQGCHKEIHKGWSQDPHGKAFNALPEPDRARVECVSCHATGKASGPPKSDLASYRTDEGVGCESCHGPGSEHVNSPNKSNIIGLGESCPECVIQSICTSCHTPAWDPGWELKTRLKAASHTATPQK